jgi:hypothetical protein
MVVSVPHSTTNEDEITDWFSVNDPNGTEYKHNILIPSHAADAATTSVVDLLHMALPLPFNHSLQVGYTISGKAIGAQVIDAWHVFAGKGKNLHQWINTLPPHRWAEVMSAGRKQIALWWGKYQTYDREPPVSQ